MTFSKNAVFAQCIVLFLFSKILMVFGAAAFPASGYILLLLSCSSYLLGAFAMFRFCKFIMPNTFGMIGLSNWRLALKSFVFLFLFSAAGFVFYFPDTLAAFASEISVSLSVFLVFAAWLLVTCIVMPLRLPLLFMARSHKFCLVYILLLPLFEMCLLQVFPLAYFGALPSPIPPATLLNEASFGATGVVTVIVDPMFDEQLRAQAAQEAEAFGLKKSWSFLDQLFADVHKKSDERVLQMIWPETMFATGSSGVQAIFSELEKRALQIGFERFELVAGVGSALENIVLRVWRNEMTGRLGFKKIAEKKRGVPAFENQMFGFSVFYSDANIEIKKQWSDIETEVDKSNLLLQSSTVKICYDAMFIDSRNFRQSEFVFTNHHIFSRFKIASLTYDYVLRLLSMVFQNNLVLAANQGSSGMVNGSWSFWDPHQKQESAAGRLTTWNRGGL